VLLVRRGARRELADQGALRGDARRKRTLPRRVDPVRPGPEYGQGPRADAERTFMGV
jgi:hypothetical protein